MRGSELLEVKEVFPAGIIRHDEEDGEVVYVTLPDGLTLTCSFRNNSTWFVEHGKMCEEGFLSHAAARILLRLPA